MNGVFISITDMIIHERYRSGLVRLSWLHPSFDSRKAADSIVPGSRLGWCNQTPKHTVWLILYSAASLQAVEDGRRCMV